MRSFIRVVHFKREAGCPSKVGKSDILGIGMVTVAVGEVEFVGLVAIVFAFDRYRHFLRGKFCVEVTTDHRNLAKFMTTTKLTGRLARWWEQLSECQFQIQYRPGEENTVADALSRYGDETPEGTYDCILPRHRFSSKALADLDAIKGRTAQILQAKCGFSSERYVSALARRSHRLWFVRVLEVIEGAGVGLDAQSASV
jgi:hypothetical protein